MFCMQLTFSEWTSNQVPESSVTNPTAMTHPRLRAGHLAVTQLIRFSGLSV